MQSGGGVGGGGWVFRRLERRGGGGGEEETSVLRHLLFPSSANYPDLTFDWDYFKGSRRFVMMTAYLGYIHTKLYLQHLFLCPLNYIHV